MCGIVGAVAQRNILPNLVDGLKRLEYRGYDSCGVALYQAGKLVRARSVDRVAHLQDVITKETLSGYTGIAHTRWATHGKPVTANAHPHFSPSAETPRIALSHNGIIENHEELRVVLEESGYLFASQTDSEVIAHLIDHLYNGDLFEAVKEAVAQLRGSYAIAVLCRDEPHRLVGARDGMPLAQLSLFALRRDGFSPISDTAAAVTR
jgi:glucosamine--fructose-6-phosphate aminotransferase (isomerizing)